MSIHFFTKFFLITFKILFCCSISREIFKGRSSESTIPRTKVNHSGINSSQSSIINTRLTYNLILLRFFFDSNMSKGARLGTNKIARNSNWPSTEKCFTAR
eukprot:Pompholyxophrys_punicea_v1_NODE_1296_length_806_cov_1.435419.p2 type:complete len:101 gc:universal NODE_1296_length_806_cov_1.435419:549-247(-)